MDEKDFEPEYYTLTDEDGNEIDFELIASAEIKGTMYYAMHPVEEDADADYYEYVILKSAIDEDGEELLVTVDDEDEFDDVADYFDDMLSDEIDYDVHPGDTDGK